MIKITPSFGEYPYQKQHVILPKDTPVLAFGASAG
jgi:hypothetical protein